MSELFLALTMVSDTTREQRLEKEREFVALFRSFQSLLQVLEMRYPEEDFEKPRPEVGFLPMIIIHDATLSPDAFTELVDFCNAELKQDFDNVLPIRVVLIGRNTDPRRL